MLYHFYQVSVVGFFLILITDWLRRGLWTKSVRWKRDWRHWNSGKNTQERNAKWVRFYHRESLIIDWLLASHRPVWCWLDVHFCLRMSGRVSRPKSVADMDDLTRNLNNIRMTNSQEQTTEVYSRILKHIVFINCFYLILKSWWTLFNYQTLKAES